MEISSMVLIGTHARLWQGSICPVAEREFVGVFFAVLDD